MLLRCLRHGATEANVAQRFNGASHDPLTQAQRLELGVVRFDTSGYDAVYCSPLGRCVETAECLGIRGWIAEPRIAERNLGIFEGLTAHECRERHARDFAAFAAFDADYRIPGGESRAENLSRVLSWLEDAAAHDRVLAITHGGTVDFLYRLGSGLPVHGGDRIHGSENATLSTFRVEWPSVTLVEYSMPLPR